MFNDTNQPASSAALSGTLAAIYFRNSYVNFELSYYFDNGDASSVSKLNKIDIQFGYGKHVYYNFADSSGHRLLSTMTWPDNATTVSYYYDASGNLTDIDHPGNNAASSISEAYEYYSGSQRILIAHSPRDYQGTSGDGGWISYPYDANNRATGWYVHGTVNPTIADGTNSGPLQPSMPTGVSVWRSAVLSYGTPGLTSMCDSDNHSADWAYDAVGRVTRTRTYFPNSSYLTTTAAYDADNQVIAATDARGNETDFANDGQGNVTAAALPSVTTSQGTFRPTSYFSHDSNDNLLASCDSVWSHANGKDWTTRPTTGATPCPSTTGTTRYTWTPTTGAPAGELTQITTPLGNHTTIGYDPASQGGTVDYSFPTSVATDSYTQADGTVRAPKTSMTYDSLGNLATSNSGSGTTTYAYDGLNRAISATDADNVTSYQSYFANGQVQKTETAAQHAGNTGATYTYSLDGSLTSETHHFGGTAGTTNYFYDSGERLIETLAPHDPSDYYAFPFVRRYWYDLTQGGTVSIGSNTGLNAFGHAFVTQEWVVPGQQSGSTPTGSPAWQTISGQSFDALDRPTASFDLGMSTGPLGQRYYDSNAQTLGLLSSSTDALGETTTYAYDAAGRATAAQYSGDGGVTPSETYTYDADGRPSTIVSGTFGTQSHQFDLDGRLTQVSEPSGGGITSAATMTYGYYPDGARSSLSVLSSGLSKSNLFQYSYRPDGRIQQQNVGLVAPAPFKWTYTAAGRLSSRSDPYTGAVISNVAAPYNTAQSYTMGPLAQTYDAYGQTATRTLPMTGQYANFTYDPEGEVTGYTGFNAPGTSNPAYGIMQASNTYNVRGELTGLHYYNQGSSSFNGTWPHSALAAANGMMVPLGDSGFAAPPSATFDPIDAALTGWTQSSAAKTYVRDVLGRQMRGNLTWGSSQSGYYTRAYDAKQRLISHAYSAYDTPGGRPDCSGNYTSNGAYSGTQTYAWGPNGRPIKMAGETLHWDGNTLLFTSNASGQVDDVKVGLKADINPINSQMIVWDRDMSGNVVSSHNNQGFGGWTIPDPYKQRCGAGASSSSPQYASAFVNAPFAKVLSPASDGITDGYNVIQGSHAYDSGTGQWSTPDSVVAKRYGWNRNNALSYSDPSGRTAFPVLTELNPIGSENALIDTSSPNAPNPAIADNGVSPANDVTGGAAAAAASQQAQNSQNLYDPPAEQASNSQSAPAGLPLIGRLVLPALAAAAVPEVAIPVEVGVSELAAAEAASGAAAAAEGAAEVGASSLYDSSITNPGSEFTNVQTNVGVAEFQGNLIASGYNVVKQTNGATILSNGTNMYALYTRTTTGGPGAQFFGNGPGLKISLDGP